MTLVNLALKNVRRNMKSYSLYIGSTVFAIVIYFTFATLKYSDDIGGDTSRQIQGVMSASAFVLMIFAAVFILYSNSFFMRKRKKEIGLYSLLGVRKKSIGFLLFFENMMIGVVSLVIGVVLGFLLSRSLLAVLLKLMGIDAVSSLTFSMDALMNTSIVFLVIFLFTSLMGYRIIYRFKLIDLFHAERKGENVPKAGLLTALAGVVSLAAAYDIALENIMNSKVWQALGLATPIIVIALTILGSYLLFHSVLVYALSVLKNSPRWAWKGLHMMTASQLLYRIRGNAKTLTIITVLSATTITAGGAVFGMYYNTEKNIQQYSPYSFMWEGKPQPIDSSIIEKEAAFPVKTIRIKTEPYEMEYAVIKEESFEQLAQKKDIQTQLKADEVFVIDAFYNEQWQDQPETMTIGGKEYRAAALYDKAFFNVQTVGGTAVVVPNELYYAIDSAEKMIRGVQVSDYKNQQVLSDELAAKTENFSSAAADYKSSIEASGTLLFTGSFLGLVFLVATGSIIFFKMMTEAEEDKAKYAVLHKIGVSKKEMKRTIRGQAGVVFAVPLLLGIVHASVALMAVSQLFRMNIFVPVVIWMAAYTLIYMMYYFVTVRSFYNTVTREFTEG